MVDEPATFPLSTEFRLGVDLVSQLPADNWNTPSPARRPWPTYLPDQSVYAPATPNLAMYVRGWQHGDQPASPELRAAMLSNGVLPSAFRPQTTFMIGHVSYTATFGLLGRPDDIIVRQTDTLLTGERSTSLDTRSPPRLLAPDMEESITLDGDVHDSLKPARPHLRRLTSDGQQLQAVGPWPGLMGRRKMNPYPDDAHIINIDSYINDNPLSVINPAGTNRVEVRGTPQLLHNYEDTVARDHERANSFVRITTQKLEAYLDPRMQEDVEQEVRPALSRYFGVAGTSRQDLADIREILASYRKVATYLNRYKPITQGQRFKAWFVDAPLYRIRPRSNDATLAYVRAGPVTWPEWRIVPRSLRSRSVSSGWSGLGLFLAGGMAFERGSASFHSSGSVEELRVEHAGALAAIFFGTLTMGVIGGSYAMNHIRRLLPDSGINLHERHFANSDRLRSATVVHEATHLVLGTDDHAYHDEPSFPRLSTTQYMTNADSYGLFAEEVSRR